MKRFKIVLSTFLAVFSFPLLVLGYSDKVILGGSNVGININSDGVLIVGFYKVNGNYNKSNLLGGDYIVKVNDKKVNTIKELVSVIDKEVVDNKVSISYRRNGSIYSTILELEYIDGIYKTGLYVKDNLVGCGTLTYIDPNSRVYAALGHNIISGETKSTIEIRDGNIFRSVVSNVTKSNDGNPGAINAKFYKKDVYGTINKNVEAGIYGNYLESIDDDSLIEVGNIDDVKLGGATIFTSLYNNTVKEYKINILNIDTNSKIKNIYFEVVDKELLKEAGGIVQGMSGSPIVQNNKLIGAVTHVAIDDVTTGYGISIITMLEEGDK